MGCLKGNLRKRVVLVPFSAVVCRGVRNISLWRNVGLFTPGLPRWT